jgi:hypothetical protein
VIHKDEHLVNALWRIDGLYLQAVEAAYLEVGVPSIV